MAQGFVGCLLWLLKRECTENTTSRSEEQSGGELTQEQAKDRTPRDFLIDEGGSGKVEREKAEFKG